MYGRDPENSFGALGYDATMMIAEAIRKIKSDQPTKISAGLTLIRELQGVTGKISFKPGRRVPDKSISILKVTNGKFALVKETVPSFVPAKELAQ